MADALIFLLFYSVSMLHLVLDVLLVVVLVELLVELVISLPTAARWISFRVSLLFGDNVCWGIFLIMDGMDLVLYGSCYNSFLLYDCCGFLSWNWLDLNWCLLLELAGWGFKEDRDFIAMLLVLTSYSNILYCDKLFHYIWFYCCTLSSYLYGWLLLRDYSSFMWYWCGILEPFIYAIDNLFWDFHCVPILVSYKEEFFLLYFSGHPYHSTFYPSKFSFNYYHFLCWKVLFFAGGRIKVLFPDLIYFIEGPSFCSFIYSLLFWARYPCRPKMSLSFHLFWSSKGTAARKVLFLFLIAALRSSSELKIPLRTLYISFKLTRRPCQDFP